MHILRTIVILLPLISYMAPADSTVPLEHQSHCRKWENGACVDGVLTDLAKSIKESNLQKTPGVDSTCGRICKEACSNCGKCSLCSFCWAYNSESCVGVGYYTDPETCEEAKTENCCDLCEAHCGGNGACAEGEYCQGGDKESSTIVKCIEQTQGEICEICEVES